MRRRPRSSPPPTSCCRTATASTARTATTSRARTASACSSRAGAPRPAYRGQPIVYNEDDHFEFDKPDNHFVAAVEGGAGWGYFDYRMSRERFEDGFQSLPVDWTISSKRKRAFFGLLKEITGA